MPYLNGLPEPGPHVDYQEFWEGCKSHELVIQKCADCGRFRHYPRPLCPRCRSFKATWEKVSGRGTVWSWTVIRRPGDPKLQENAPYNIVEIELAEQPGLCLTGNLVDCEPEDIEIGLPVEVVFETVSGNTVLPRFKRANR